MRPTMERVGLGALGALALGCVPRDEAPATTLADLEALSRMGPEAVRVDPSLDRELVARAQPDECFDEIGFWGGAPPCEAGERPKINEAYLWAAARSGDYAYFGTIANVPCMISGSYFGALAPFETDDMVCEGGAGPSADVIGSPAYGDQRPPRILRVNADTDAIEDVTPTDDPLLLTTIGLRGAGAHDDVVLMAGQNFVDGKESGLNMWALEGSTGRVIGSTTLTDYQDMRRGIVVGDDLYLGVRRAGEGFGGGGYVVKWVGDKVDPFLFVTVGHLATEPGFLTEHEGRIAAGGWSAIGTDQALGETAGLYLSPMVPPDGLTSADADRWEEIFRIDDYDPDPVIAKATYFGDLASFGGRLFFSTYQVPFYQTANAFTAYGRPETWPGRLRTFAKAERATTVFVMDDAGTPRQEVTLLYGEATLPAFDVASGDWRDTPNNLGQAPRYGASGFGNRMNKYSWTWTVFDDRLYMATFDASGTAGLFVSIAGQPSLLDLPLEAAVALQPLVDRIATTRGGGDLWRFDDPYGPAVAEDLTGYGNPSNYGLRVFVPFEDKGKLYGGTANPFNLRTGPDAPGGWELLSFTPTE